MATKVSEYTREDGHVIAVYESGLERDTVDGRIVKPAKSAIITAETSKELHRKRQEKAAAKLRERILASTQRRSDVKLSGSAEAVAEAGGYIWDEVVLGEDVYPRDRLEAWEKLSKYAGVLPADVKRDTQDNTQAVAQAAAAGAAVATALERVLRDVLGARHEVIDATTDDDGGAGADNGRCGVG